MQDLPTVVGMLADDDLGAAREDVSVPLNPHYVQAFEAIERDLIPTVPRGIFPRSRPDIAARMARIKDMPACKR